MTEIRIHDPEVAVNCVKSQKLVANKIMLYVFSTKCLHLIYMYIDIAVGTIGDNVYIYQSFCSCWEHLMLMEGQLEVVLISVL